MSEVCRLCAKEAPLLASHILPAFAYKALKKNSVTGHIRHSEAPNRRVQDGVTLPWLCEECEARFSRWEREFSNNVFHPWNAGALHTVYGAWMLKFCVSVSWRVLLYCKGHNPSTIYSAEDEKLFVQAERIWREFLLDERPHPGAFSQQFVIFDIIESTNVEDLPDNINRFMTGAISMDIVGSSRSIFTWAKLGRYQIFGTVKEGPNKFEGTKVHVKQGAIMPGKIVLPAGLLDLYREKALHAKAAMANLSDAQFDKIDAAVDANIDKLTKSGQIQAIIADAEMFGPQAIIRAPRQTPKATS